MKITHVRVSLKDNRYHRAIPGEPSINIPHSLYDMIVTFQTGLDDLHLQAKRYGAEMRDKPMFVQKNHPIPLEPGEVVKL